jgi:hypothetical protein
MNEVILATKQKVYHQFKQFVTITCYLWVVFALFTFYKSIVLSEQHIPFAPYGLAFVNALVMAKVMLIAQGLHFGKWFNKSPLLYATLFKSVAFAVLLSCFKILEEILTGWYHARPLNESIGQVAGGTLGGILVVMAIFAVILIPFFAFAELSSVLGGDRLRELLFASRQNAGS